MDGERAGTIPSPATGLPVRELLDRATLAADARWPGASITDLESLPGGVSSLTFAARLHGAAQRSGRIVVKVAPPGLEPVRNRDVLRQARVLRALRAAPRVLVPEVLLTDAGSPPDQPPFFVMEYARGEAYEPQQDLSPRPPDPPTVAARARAAARMLAHIHALEPGALGLGDEPALSPAAELTRWSALYATCEDELRGEESRLRDRLRETVPVAQAPRILHGDYRLGNIQFVGPELTAVIDWEIWSAGDPRADLAWLLIQVDPVLRFHAGRDPANERAAAAMPARGVLLAEYLAVRPIDVAGLDWFRACSYYKIAATTAALAKRNRRLAEPDPGLQIAAATLPEVITRGLRIAEGAAVRG